jgi:hypothetical protein
MAELPSVPSSPSAAIALPSSHLSPAPTYATSPRRRADQLTNSADEQIHILEALRANLAVHHETLEDPELMMVLAEGETTLLEAIDFILEADLIDEALIQGLKTSKDTLAVRLHRLQERRASRRAILEQALFLLERKSLERPTATLTLSDRAPALVVEEEAQIPARFFDLKPVLNRRLLKEALEAGDEIAGAKLSNGSVTITVRRR